MFRGRGASADVMMRHGTCFAAGVAPPKPDLPEPVGADLTVLGNVI